MKNIFLLISVLFIIFLVVIYFFPLKLKKSGPFCAQVIVKACHSVTGECREFPNSCNLPYFWDVKN